MYRHGVQATTLAEVATDAEVPPGNVYYYFKTKDDLVRSVVDSRVGQAREMLDRLQSRRTPRIRLKALAREWLQMRELVTAHGCPFGTMVGDLGHSQGDSARDAGRPFAVILAWTEAQFREMGRRDSQELAVVLISGIQGAAVLAQATADPAVVATETRHLERWLDTL
jgi:AcrR family transcriptional regulator